MAAFYSKHFGFKTSGEVVEGLIELQTAYRGACILIYQAVKSVKLGQESMLTVLGRRGLFKKIYMQLP